MNFHSFLYENKISDISNEMKRSKSLEPAVNVRNVVFEYKKNSSVLKNISIKVPEGMSS